MSSRRVMCVSLGAVATLLSVAAPVMAGETIDTYAGSGQAGYSGDGGAALGADIDKPTGLFVAANGDVYFADTNNFVVRKVDAATGLISTVAGGGAPAIGDGQLATDAWLNKPQTMAVDAAGNTYIADTDNHRIRKVDAATGLISTIAGTGTQGYSGDGGPGTSAMLNKPKGVAVDSAGNVIVADTDNHRIRMIDPAGTISTIAGTGSAGSSGDGGAATAAKLNKPNAVAIDGADTVYVADTDNHRIRKFTVGGTISTVAGTGTAGFGGDGGSATSALLNKPKGVAVDAAANVYVADTTNHRIRKVTVASGIIDTIAGTGVFGYSGDGGPATSAQLNKPEGLVVDAAGDVFIGDTKNHRVRKVDVATGFISTYGGTGTAGYSGDAGPATSAMMEEPRGVLVDAAGDLLLSDSKNHVIRKIAAATGTITVVAGTPLQNLGSPDGVLATDAYLDKPEDVTLDTAGNLYIACPKLKRVRKVDASTAIITTIIGSGTEFAPADPTEDVMLLNPTGVAIDDGGNVYVADSDPLNSRIVKFTVAGATYATIAGVGTTGFSGDGGPATAAGLNEPNDLGVDQNGNVYIADTLNHRIRKIDAVTGLISTVAGNGNAGYFGDGGQATAAWLKKPVRVAADLIGHIYIADKDNHAIRKVYSHGVIVTIAGSGVGGYFGDSGPAKWAQLKKPAGVGFVRSGTGYLYISDTDNHRIRFVNHLINGTSKPLVLWEEVEP